MRVYDARESDGCATQRSAHATFAGAMYHFFEKQLNHLPESSARVIHLIKAMVLYLQPWGAPPKAGGAAGGGAPTSPGGDGGGEAADAAAATMAMPTKTPAEAAADAGRWVWAGFVKRNYLLYVRLLTSVAREVRQNRFEFNPKVDAKKCEKDLEMLKCVASIFDHPHVLPLLRTLGETLEHVVSWQGAEDSPLRQCLEEQVPPPAHALARPTARTRIRPTATARALPTSLLPPRRHHLALNALQSRHVASRPLRRLTTSPFAHARACEGLP